MKFTDPYKILGVERPRAQPKRAGIQIGPRALP